jgi:hypothetical protein
LDTIEFGLVGERLAARAMERAGMRVIGSRVVTPAGEVDLVAIDGDALVCIEVKSGRTRKPLTWFAGQPGLDASGHWRPGHRFGIEDFGRVARASRWLAQRLGSKRGRLLPRVDLCEFLVAQNKSVSLGMFHHLDLREPLERTFT